MCIILFCIFILCMYHVLYYEFTSNELHIVDNVKSSPTFILLFQIFQKNNVLYLFITTHFIIKHNKETYFAALSRIVLTLKLYQICKIKAIIQ